MKSNNKILNNKTILVTGGTGSFGQEFTRIVLKKYKPKALRIFSRGEFLQWEMSQKFKDDRLRFFIGDIRDKDRLYRAMNEVDIVIHAAALKHIPVAEYNPIEAINTNIVGTANVIDAAIDNNVKKTIFINSDKAVNPVNLYGATKLCAEKLFIQANSYTGTGKTRFSCVRYGNVVGSRGSVIPVFFEQKKKGIITITDKRMTRFWITLEQGVIFVINSIKKMQGGEVFIPKLPSMRIIDLAEVIAPKAKIKIIGIRPGEKLHEALLISEEIRHSKEFDKYIVVEPEHPFWKKDNFKGGRPLPDDFKYTSDISSWWLTKNDLRKMIESL